MISPGSMGHWTSPKTFIYYIWDFILVWTFGGYFLAKQLLQSHKEPTGLKVREKQVAIITGGSRGIGLEIVRQLLAQHIHVIIVSSSQSGADLLNKLKTEFPDGEVEYYTVDISCRKSVRNFAAKFLERDLPLHLLINNAGIMFVPFKMTEDGTESHLSTNYLGHFLLIYLLLPKLIESGTSLWKSRIINVSSCCHFAGYMKIDDLNCSEYYSAHGTYAQSKLAQVMHTILLQELLEKNNVPVTVNAVHPGIIDTKLYQHTMFDVFPFAARWFFKTPQQGADGIVHVALSETVEGVGGKYFENCEIVSPNRLAVVRELQEKLWQKTCKMLDLTDFDHPNVSTTE